MVDHHTLLARLHTSFGISGAAFSWLHLYLTGRSQCVRTGQYASTFKHCSSGVPQGSICPRSPSVYHLYITYFQHCLQLWRLSATIRWRHPIIPMYTSSRDLTPNLNTLESCLTSLHAWFCHNGLGLNSGKSESILFGTSTRLRNFPPLTGVNIAGTVVSLSYKIVTLGVTLDSNLTLSNHISNICRSAHYHIRALRHQAVSHRWHG